MNTELWNYLIAALYFTIAFLTFAVSIHGEIEFNSTCENKHKNNKDLFMTLISKKSAKQQDSCLTLKGGNVADLFKIWLKQLKQPLMDIFPLDKETETKGNQVRQVHSAIFSVVKLTPLQANPMLVSVHLSVMTSCLDLDQGIVASDLLTQLTNGDNVSGLLPPALAHRYGGHQFGYWAGISNLYLYIFKFIFLYNLIKYNNFFLPNIYRVDSLHSIILNSIGKALFF